MDLHTYSGSLLGNTSCYIVGSRAQANSQLSELRKQKSEVMILVWSQCKPTRRSWKWEINRRAEIINLLHIWPLNYIWVWEIQESPTKMKASGGLWTCRRLVCSSAHTQPGSQKGKNIMDLRCLSRHNLCLNQPHRCRR